MKVLKFALCAAVVAGLMAVGPAALAGPSACSHPADVLDLGNWKVTLPVGSSGKPKEVKQPALATFAADPWFVANSACDGVVFRAAVNGVTTSGSKNPRSELREMDGSENASWSSTSGKHTLTVREAFTHLPEVKPQVVGAQIHDADDDIQVFRLEGKSLYLTNGDTTHYKLITDDYQLGTPFEAKFEVGGGKVKAYYNGVLQSTLSKGFSGAYFKAGAYTQANCDTSSPCSGGNYGEVTVYGVAVGHS